MRLTRWLFAFVFLVPVNVVGQASPPEAVIYAQIERRCATAEQDAFLAREIQLRLPTAFIVRGDAESLEQKWKITWAPVPDGTCELLFEGGGNRSQMSLGPNASYEELQLAASRIAWLTSVSKSESKTETEEPIADAPKEKPVSEASAKVTAEADSQSAGLNTVSSAISIGKAMSFLEETPIPIVVVEPPVTPSEEIVGWKFSLFPPLDITSEPARHPVPRLSLNVFAGSTHSVRGVEVGMGVNHIENDLNGVQIGILGNVVGNRVDGIQIAGLFNYLSGQLDRSGQLSALFNVAGAQSDGIQFAFGSNVVGDESSTVQIAVANVAGDQFDGVQAGLLNINGNGDGLQFGIANITETGDMSLGLVNIFWGEPLHVIGWASSAVDLLVGLQHGGTLLKYNYLIGVGSTESAEVFKFGLGLGLHGTFGRMLTSYELNAFQVLPTGAPVDRLSLQLQLKTSLAYPFGDRFALFGGADLNVMFTGYRDPTVVLPAFAFELQSPTNGSAGTFVWPGLHIGFRI